MLQSPVKTEPIWNLPITFTSMIGREQEIATICTTLLLPDVRLLTLVGPGGIGKTRLVLQTAIQLRERFTDGVCFLALASFTDPQLLIPTLAQELHIREVGEQPLFEQVKFALRDRHLLLLLDNFEHMMINVSIIEELLVSCPLLKVIVTSREVLRLAAEHLYPVPSLSLPDLAQLPESKLLTQYAAVALFMQRAQTIMPAFQLTAVNARAIAEICVRLDGLPLAIEFAAARVRLLTPQVMLARLSLDLFGSGPRTAPQRQQTLRNALKWSYDLLDEQEQRRFRRLSVFVGGWTLEAVESVWSAGREEIDDALSVLDGIDSLLNKSLLLQLEEEGSEPYLIMLKIVREYALERLQESGEIEPCRRAHALYYLRFVEDASSFLKNEQQISWLKRLEYEQENLWAALGWLIEHQEAELALRFCSALHRYWYLSGYWSEGRRWLQAALALPQAEGTTVARAAALYSAGDMAYYQDDYPASLAFLQESVALCREPGNTQVLAAALSSLGVLVHVQGDSQAAHALFRESEQLCRSLHLPWELASLLRKWAQRVRSEGDAERAFALGQEALRLARTLGDTQLTATTLLTLGDIASLQGQVTLAQARDQEALTCANELNDRYLTAIALQNLAYLASLQNDLEQTHVRAQEALTVLRTLGDKMNMTSILHTLGHIALQQHNLLQAIHYHQEGLALAQEITHAIQVGWHLVGLAEVYAVEGKPYRAACLSGLAESYIDIGTDMNSVERADYDQAIAKVREQLGEKVYSAAFAEGRTLTPQQALAVAEPVLASPVPTLSSLSQRPTYPDGLTVAEVEILGLLARGLSNKEIAEHRISSPNTVRTQLDSIYRKIGVNSRSEAILYAIDKKLV